MVFTDVTASSFKDIDHHIVAIGILGVTTCVSVTVCDTAALAGDYHRVQFL